MPSASRRRRTSEDSEEEEVVRPTQRRRRSRSDDEDEDENDDAVIGDNGAEDGRDGDTQMVKRFVRYALSCEYQRKYIRRADIADKGMRTQFKPYYEKTQEALRNTFGMEMCELPAKEKITLREKKAAQKSKSVATSTSYILKSILPAEYQSPKIIPPSTIVSASEEASYVGLCTMIVTLISMSPQQQCLEAKLLSYLAKLNLDTYMLGEKTAVILKKMSAQGYIYKSVEKTPDDETILWLVGPRGKIEIGNDGIAGFVSEVYGESAPVDLEKRLDKTLQTESGVMKPKVLQSREVDDDDSGNGGPGPSTQGRRTRRG
ncbi:MAGE family-domain-containing protein [Calycina marina]|uniref:MAGE family-domain-containing protein n=1 Tax=Calycina marina TaxID=1763456 RepID=A0A9P7YYM8_9HELO|nr:MAGE family-domain-containing protein [Calycina marina]